MLGTMACYLILKALFSFPEEMIAVLLWVLTLEAADCGQLLPQGMKKWICSFQAQQGMELSFKDSLMFNKLVFTFTLWCNGGKDFNPLDWIPQLYGDIIC